MVDGVLFDPICKTMFFIIHVWQVGTNKTPYSYTPNEILKLKDFLRFMFRKKICNIFHFHNIAILVNSEVKRD